MKTVTSITIFNDAVGKRMSLTYSEINEETGQVISDNNRIDRVIVDSDTKALINSLETVAQSFIDSYID